MFLIIGAFSLQRQDWGTMFLQPSDGWFYILRFCSWPVRASLSAGKACHGGGRHISFRCGCIMACTGFRTAFPVSFRFLRGYCRHGASFPWQNVPQGGDSFLPVHRVGRCGGIWRGSISASVLSIVALFYLRLFWFRLFYRLRRWQ